MAIVSKQEAVKLLQEKSNHLPHNVTSQRILKAGIAGRGISLPPAHWHSLEGGLWDTPGQEQTLLKNKGCFS